MVYDVQPTAPVRSYLLSEVIIEDVKREKRPTLAEIASSTGDGSVYHIGYSDIIKRFTCDCPDWQYRRLATGENCKHIKAYIARI